MKSGGDKQRVSQEEVLAAQTAAAKNARYESAFRPLEQRAIAELDSADESKRAALLSGRGNADVNQQAGTAESMSRTGHAGSNFKRNLSIGKATEAVKTDADKTAQNSITGDAVNVVRTGQNVSRQSQNGLTFSARLANSKARTILAADQVVDNAKGRAAGNLLSTAVSGGFAANDVANAKNADGGFETPTNELNFVQKRFFARGR